MEGEGGKCVIQLALYAAYLKREDKVVVKPQTTTLKRASVFGLKMI